ncbi:endonuclease/exonuclease/phosphatase family protein [Azospirillum sp.]|uniref:endonuclease/exonuclease/phosphatase family protein n=1 Tax=Azospirillum sp. TaxID=34012 RepID=UPI002D6DC107|nr:endonuclease/exonuclease/phosphatase family protein [Azospirillum sp.]HYD70211.1 endonuclease/exonuclease/phosphatase family protein [Azospirillum sp.]
MSQIFRLATFNLENLDDRAGLDPPLDERLGILRPQFERLAADIVCLQEVNGQRESKEGPRRLKALDRLLEGSDYAGFHRAVASPTASKVADKHNLVILSRWPITASRSLRHDLVPPPRLKSITADPPGSGEATVGWDRPVLHAEIELGNGRRLHVFNLHLRAPLAVPVAGQKESAHVWKSVSGWAEGYFLASLKRDGQALETRLAVDRVFDAEPDALVVVAGDYNAETRQTPVRLIRGDVEDTGNGRLAARALVPLERNLPEGQRFSVLHAGQPVLLDHLLVSRTLLGWFRKAEIHNETLGDELVAQATIAHSPESTHAPVVAEFVLPPDNHP